MPRGPGFTAADIMSVFSLTTMRLFQPVDLAPHPNILATCNASVSGPHIARHGQG